MTFETSAVRIFACKVYTPAKSPKDVGDYRTKVHEIFIRRRGIIVDVLQSIVAAVYLMLNASAQNEDGVCQFSPIRAANRLPYNH